VKLIVINFSLEINEKLTIPNLTVWMNDPTLVDIKITNEPHPLSTGILIVNIGTPATLEPREIRKYLRQFLSDRRVIRWPRWLWLPLLHLIILRVRPGRLVSKYKEIWTEGGSPKSMGCMQGSWLVCDMAIHRSGMACERCVIKVRNA